MEVSSIHGKRVLEEMEKRIHGSSSNQAEMAQEKALFSGRRYRPRERREDATQTMENGNVNSPAKMDWSDQQLYVYLRAILHYMGQLLS